MVLYVRTDLRTINQATMELYSIKYLATIARVGGYTIYPALPTKLKKKGMIQALMLIRDSLFSEEKS
jgi:hypothetical protein